MDKAVIIVNSLVKEKIQEAEFQASRLNNKVYETLLTQQKVYEILVRLQAALAEFPGVLRREECLLVEMSLKYTEDFKVFSDYAEVSHTMKMLDYNMREIRKRQHLWQTYKEALLIIERASEIVFARIQNIWKECEDRGIAQSVRDAVNIYGTDMDFWPGPDVKPIENDLLGAENRLVLYWARYLYCTGKRLLAEVSFLAEKRSYRIDNWQMDALEHYKEVVKEIKNTIEELENDEETYQVSIR